MKKRLLLHLLLGAIAIVSALAVAAFLIYTLVLRSSFKADALEINEAFRTHNSVTVSRGALSFQASPEENESYNMFLMNRNTAVFSRKAIYRYRGRQRDRPVLENRREGKTLHCAESDDFCPVERVFYEQLSQSIIV